MHKTIITNEIVESEYLDDKNILFQTIHKPASTHPELFRDALNAGLQAIEEYGITKWLSDDSKNGAHTQEVMEWVEQEWAPEAIEAGWKYWAIVVPTDIKAAGAMMPIIGRFGELGLRMRVFTTVDDAMDWLDSLPDN